MEQRLTQNKMSLTDFAAGHEFFGLHFNGNECIFREWAPNADVVYIIGEMTHWREIPEYSLRPAGPGGTWEMDGVINMRAGNGIW